jgi:hypothetical protein
MPQNPAPLPNHQLLMHVTADMLALPEMLCRHRQCRREHACKFHRSDTLEPTCLTRFWPYERALFDELLAIVLRIHDGTQHAQPSGDSGQRELEAAAIEIIRASLPLMPEITGKFEDWCRRYRAPPAPPVDTGKLLADIRAELAHDKMLLEIAEIRADQQKLGRPPQGFPRGDKSVPLTQKPSLPNRFLTSFE